MKIRITWFLIGAVVSWLTWSVIGYIRLRPRDFTQSWTNAESEVAPNWLKHAKGRKIGSIMVFAPPAETPACALIHPPKPNHFPQIMLRDENSDGNVDSLLIVDKMNRTFLISVKDADGIFDSSQYSTGAGKDSVSISDTNMDGLPDFRLGPGRAMAVTIDDQWHDLMHTNKKQYVVINGTRSQVKAVDGVWQLIEEE